MEALVEYGTSRLTYFFLDQNLSGQIIKLFRKSIRHKQSSSFGGKIINTYENNSKSCLRAKLLLNESYVSRKNVSKNLPSFLNMFTKLSSKILGHDTSPDKKLSGKKLFLMNNFMCSLFKKIKNKRIAKLINVKIRNFLGQFAS